MALGGGGLWFCDDCAKALANNKKRVTKEGKDVRNCVTPLMDDDLRGPCHPCNIFKRVLIVYTKKRVRLISVNKYLKMLLKFSSKRYFFKYTLCTIKIYPYLSSLGILSCLEICDITSMVHLIIKRSVKLWRHY